MKCYFLLVLSILLKSSIISCHQRLDLERFIEWNKLDFQFPSTKLRNEAIAHGLFVVENAFPIDVDVDYRGSVDRSRIFVTIPRFSEGIPVTLGYLTEKSKNDFMIKPYPDYSWHSSHGTDCDGITSVVRTAIDDCNQLYVLDTGIIGETKKCPPQLLVFNLVDDSLVRRYKFPDSQYTESSLFITPVVDVKDSSPNGKCADAKVYIADVTGFSLIVYDTLTDKSWKIQNKLFYPYPEFGTFTIAGESFDLMDGIFGLALSPKQFSNDDNNNAIYEFLNRPYERFLYFHSLASGVESVVSLNLLNNHEIWEHDSESEPRAFKSIGTRTIQTAAQAMDKNGNLYFVTMYPLALVCWDSLTRYSPENIRILVENDQTLQFASGLKIVENLRGMEELWVVTNRLQKIWTETINFNETNFRIQHRGIRELLGNRSRCNGRPIRSDFIFPAFGSFQG
ncbi:CLUMA_CG003717, isoform A [Clunio marinus]|uniref:CLUMA_CG003717, isoform A n=1 Tax=Clunio marinus TaxID=568069 RepID=A0A1J1HPL9_9DIPT|nr:CLUMA_CG003717, isoform A [Clunio marinus]